jgi:hypothetical protein
MAVPACPFIFEVRCGTERRAIKPGDIELNPEGLNCCDREQKCQMRGPFVLTGECFYRLTEHDDLAAVWSEVRIDLRCGSRHTSAGSRGGRAATRLLALSGRRLVPLLSVSRTPPVAARLRLRRPGISAGSTLAEPQLGALLPLPASPLLWVHGC